VAHALLRRRGQKNHFSYNADPVKDEDLLLARVKMEQFFARAFQTFPGVHRSGTKPMRERLELRALDPVAQCLIRRLTVPRVYFEAEWPGMPGSRVDVLAIDRDGVGDAHLIEIRRRAADALAILPTLFKAHAPFRWIAFVRGTEDEPAARALTSQEPLYAEGSAGRIGVIEIVEMSSGDLGANVRLTAERFPDAVYDLATAFSGSHKANIQFGG
jgi:hypothetical protein